jgi:hypothetical protein
MQRVIGQKASKPVHLSGSFVSTARSHSNSDFRPVSQPERGEILTLALAQSSKAGAWARSKAVVRFPYTTV